MEAKRKQKGGVGSDLQIRNLDADTLKNLQELQEFFGVGTNSKAVLSCVRQFIQYKNEVSSLRLQLRQALQTINAQSEMLKKIGGVVDTFRSGATEYD